MSEHTPGPWEWRWQDRRTFQLESDAVEYPDMDPIVTCYICPACGKNSEERFEKDGRVCLAPTAANAALIAAAPNMLDEIEKTAAFLDGLHTFLTSTRLCGGYWDNMLTDLSERRSALLAAVEKAEAKKP